MSLESDELEELTGEIRRLIESNRAFLERVSDDAYDDPDEAEEGQKGEDESVSEDYEEL